MNCSFTFRPDTGYHSIKFEGNGVEVECMGAPIDANASTVALALNYSIVHIHQLTEANKVLVHERDYYKDLFQLAMRRLIEVEK